MSRDCNIGAECWMRLDEAMLAELRAIWWRARRNGVVLPAQRGIIIVDGDKADEGIATWTPAA